MIGRAVAEWIYKTLKHKRTGEKHWGGNDRKFFHEEVNGKEGWWGKGKRVQSCLPTSHFAYSMYQYLANEMAKLVLKRNYLNYINGAKKYLYYCA